MAVIGILYDEMSPDFEYESVYVFHDVHGKSIQKNFNSGDFIKDWFNAIKFFVTEIANTYEPLIQSSSVDHYIHDTNKYDSAYLHIENEIPLLKYIDRSDDNWFINQKDIFENNIELFVIENTKPTWEELKESCK